MERISISWTPANAISPTALPDQSLGDGRDVRDRSIPRIRFVFPDDPEGLAPAVVSPERHPMPESDGAEIRRRRNEPSCPEAIGEISHVPRGDRDSVTTLGGVRDPLSRVIGSASFPHCIGQRLQSRRGHQIRMRRDWPIRQLDLRGRFGASSRVKATLIVSTFPFSGRSLPVTERCFGD
jgi:hypothetical protein